MCQARTRTEAVKLYEDEGIGITRQQWQNLYKFVNVEIFRDPSNAVEYMIRTGEENVMLNIILGNENMYSMDGGCCYKLFVDTNLATIGDRKCQCWFICIQKVYFTWLRFRGLLYRIFTHHLISRFIDLLVWIGTMVLIYEISTPGEDLTLDKISDILVIVFVVEVSLRFVAFGKYFLRDGFNILDFLVVWGTLLVDFVDVSGDGDQSSNGLVAFRLLRFVRALGTIDRFKMIISTSITVLSKVGVLFSLEFCVFYIFAVVGAFCYGGYVTKEAALQQLADAIDAEDVDNTGFWAYIRDNYYYDNNMNYIANTVVVMVELTVVNQWHAITRMYVELTSAWTYLYFYFLFCISINCR